ncbi:MFS transporter [Leifsonia sp. NPDC058248]|uniref:MFS transporter n=1 Tax=Leifsonia sp. NPDC058248 TaxID=3346402 RepID=UPI0036DCBBCC
MAIAAADNPGLPHARSRARHLTGFWLVTGAVVILQAFATLPTPLWPLYAEQDGLTSTLVTVAFAITVVGTVVGLVFFGHLSDRFGRRPIIVPALAVGVGVAVVMMVWPAYPGLLVGRFLTGLAVGLVASTATTYLSDLYRAARPSNALSRFPSTVASIALLGGLSLGPLVSGVIAQWFTAPLTTSYLVFIVAMTGGIVAVSLSPETVDRQAFRREQTRRFRLREGRRLAFIGASAVAFCSFGGFGVLLSLGSLIVQNELHVAAPVIWGFAAFVALGVSAVSQIALGALSPSWMLGLGTGAAAVGFLIIIVGLFNPSLTLFLIGAGIAGAGLGLLFKSALAVAATTADPAATAGVIAIFFTITYLGQGLPPVLLAIATSFVSPQVGLCAFAVAIVAVTLVAARLQVSALRKNS